MRKLNLLSIVLPCHNEEEVLPSTHKRLKKILEDLLSAHHCCNYELVYVDNGSTDGTLKVLENFFNNDHHVRIFSLRRNFGYQGSISAGLAHARGDAVVTIDADLQDPPEKISEMIFHYEHGTDLVLGVRKNRSSDSLLKRFFSEKYYRVLKILGVDVVPNHGDFRLMSRALVDQYNQLTERNRFIRGLVLQFDSLYKTVEYSRTPRTSGKSKFGLSSLFSLGLDGLVSFTYIPLRLVSLMGILLCILTFFGILWTLYKKLAYDSLPGWASTLLPLLGLGGFQIFALGLMGEYIGRLYVEVKHRPLFTVRKVYETSLTPDSKNNHNE